MPVSQIIGESCSRSYCSKASLPSMPIKTLATNGMTATPQFSHDIQRFWLD